MLRFKRPTSRNGREKVISAYVPDWQVPHAGSLWNMSGPSLKGRMRKFRPELFNAKKVMRPTPGIRYCRIVLCLDSSAFRGAEHIAEMVSRCPAYGAFCNRVENFDDGIHLSEAASVELSAMLDRELQQRIAGASK